jgi:hypothetical protein
MPEIALHVTFGWQFAARQGPLPQSSFMAPVVAR